MSGPGFDLAALSDAVDRHKNVVRVVICGFEGSSPRETGASMLFWDEGQSDTIGGGALEMEATRIAQELLRQDGAWLRRTRTITLGPSLGQCCGGSVSILAERFTKFELTQIPPDAPFARAMTSGVPNAPPSFWNSDTQINVAGGQVIEIPIPAPTPLWLYGAGHVGRALVHALNDLPFQITWVDTDRTRFPSNIPTYADALVAHAPADAVKHAPPDAHHFVMTYSHTLDLEICHQVLSTRFQFLGLIGSTTKRARFHARLRKLGHSDATIARLNCPIGDPELGKTPAAIALGVVHGLLKSVEETSLRCKEGSAA